MTADPVQRSIIDESYRWTKEELLAERLRPVTDFAGVIDDPALTVSPERRVWLNRWISARGDSSSAPGIDTITLANDEQPRR